MFNVLRKAHKIQAKTYEEFEEKAEQFLANRKLIKVPSVKDVELARWMLIFSILKADCVRADEPSLLGRALMLDTTITEDDLYIYFEFISNFTFSYSVKEVCRLLRKADFKEDLSKLLMTRKEIEGNAKSILINALKKKNRKPKKNDYVEDDDEHDELDNENYDDEVEDEKNIKSEKFENNVETHFEPVNSTFDQKSQIESDDENLHEDDDYVMPIVHIDVSNNEHKINGENINLHQKNPRTENGNDADNQKVIIVDKKDELDAEITCHDFSQKLFAVLEQYLAENKSESRFDLVDKLITNKFKEAYSSPDGTKIIKKFDYSLNNPDRHSTIYTVAALILQEKFEFLQLFISITRKSTLLQSASRWIGEPYKVKSLIAFAPLETDISMIFMRRLTNLTLIKGLVDHREILHFLNDIVYFSDKTSVAVRSTCFSASVSALHRRGEPDNVIQECFNMMLGCTEPEFLARVNHLLKNDPVYDKFDSYIVELYATPFDERLRYIKGHVPLLIRENTLAIMETDERINMDPTDMNSMPNQIAMRMSLISDEKAKQKLSITLEKNETINNLIKGGCGTLLITGQDVFSPTNACSGMIENGISTPTEIEEY